MSSADPAARLHELLGYVEQIVKLDERPAMCLSDHRLGNGRTYVFHQHEFHVLPGVSHDGSDDDGPIWLAIERLKRSEPPLANPDLSDWVEVVADPDKAPILREFVLRTVSTKEKDLLIASAKVRQADCEPSLVSKEKAEFDVRFRIEDNPQISVEFDKYLAEHWLPWASKERPRRCSISLYQKLFELVQLMELGSAEQAIELVWGIGLSRWVKDVAVIDLPLLERLVELELDEASGGTIRVRPRQARAHANLRPYEELKLDGVPLALDGTRRALAMAEEDEGVSPYRRDGFELILRGCQTRLDPEGRYLPDVSKDDPASAVPEPGRQLVVSDRWVIFARKRSENFLLRDIENLKGSIERQKDDLPGPAKTLVMGPEVRAEQAWAPLSNSLGEAITPAFDSSSESPLGDLFFPKPFNREQIEIVKRLDRAEGVVVQGPPGTGKTHTIANIICHYLATGRRVLVVSHGEAALTVLRDKLPEAVRDLAISITTSEKEGLRQVEGAIRLLQSVVQSIRPGEQARAIGDIEQSIMRMRARLKDIDAEIERIARAQLSEVDGAGLRPAELAKRLLESRAQCEWFTDRPALFASKSGITEEMISALRKARASLGKRLENSEDRLPSIEDLPTGRVLAGLHQDLVRAAELSALSASAEVKLRITSLEEIDDAVTAADALDVLLRCALQFEIYDWLAQFADPRRGAASPMRRPLEMLLEDLDAIVVEYPEYVQRPVVIPSDSHELTEFAIVVAKLAAGERAFGLFAFKEKVVRPAIESVRVVGRPPAGAEDWEHVRRFMNWRGRVGELQSRWTALAQEIGLPSGAPLDPKDMAQLAAALRSILISVPEQLGLLERHLTQVVLGEREELWPEVPRMLKLRDSLRNAAAAVRLSATRDEIARVASLFSESVGKLAPLAHEFVLKVVGRNDVGAERIEATWNGLLARIDDLKRHRAEFDTVCAVTTTIAEAGAPQWAERLRTMPAVDGPDSVLLPNWSEAWDWAAADRLLANLDQRARLSELSEEKLRLEETVGREFERLVRERTYYALAQSMTGPVRAALMMFATALRKIGKGTGAGAERHRRAARQAMSACYGGVPCWIMPSWRVAEQLPGEVGSFDLVIMDEASQSDIRELPALLRGKKILVVGDDRQVSPTAAFIENAKIDRLERTFLSKQPFKTLLLPGSSLYDLAKVMFPDKFVMLREHFRCVEPIIRFSSQFYTEDLVPLRVPTGNERLDPPLVDIFVTDGYRSGDKINHRESEVIVSEIRRICETPSLARISDDWRSIGVISLIGSKQAALINRMLLEELGEEMIVRHRIACGDSATFQGNERDIVFLSMVADQRSKQAQTAMHFEQRFNVAMSRARDRVYLVRSVREDDLNPNDLKAKVIRHFKDPMLGRHMASGELALKCDSDFERDVLRRLLKSGYRVRPQVGAAGYSIDLVVEGVADRRLAVECDGDKYHGPERWADDMARQRVLERVGWRFWRCWASTFTLDPDGCMVDLFATLDRMGIEPHGARAGDEIYTEHRRVEPSSHARAQAAEAPEDLKADAGIRVGDRVIVRYLDNNKQLSFVLSMGRDDPTNGIVSTASPLGSKLLGLNEEDEVEFEANGKLRRAIIVKTERGESALTATPRTPSAPAASSELRHSRPSGPLDTISA